MSNFTINKEEEKILELGLNYAFEIHFLQDLITDTENAINHLDAKEQNIYRFFSTQEDKTNTKHQHKQHVT
jgi:hypothetical protein